MPGRGSRDSKYPTKLQHRRIIRWSLEDTNCERMEGDSLLREPERGEPLSAGGTPARELQLQVISGPMCPFVVRSV